jgi:hypothetical protein
MGGDQRARNGERVRAFHLPPPHTTTSTTINEKKKTGNDNESQQQKKKKKKKTKQNKTKQNDLSPNGTWTQPSMCCEASSTSAKLSTARSLSSSFVSVAYHRLNRAIEQTNKQNTHQRTCITLRQLCE